MTAIDTAKDYLESSAEWRCATAKQIIRDLIAEREAVCTWTEDASGIWHTDCGEAFEIQTGSPGQNGLRYCCFCGRRLAEGST